MALAEPYDPGDFPADDGLDEVCGDVPRPVPDIISWTMHKSFADRGTIYPRQGTLLKILFLRDDLFTDYDYEVIDEWSSGFALPPQAKRNPQDPLRYEGYEGMPPDILDRIEWCKERGRLWFREALFVGGRRGGKGFIGALAGAYILYWYIRQGDPQKQFGISRDKKLTAMVFAMNRDHAKTNQWRDLVDVVLGAPCFRKYINRPLAESLSVMSSHDIDRVEKLAKAGIRSILDMASFSILPKEATKTAGRGPASFLLYFDEMAHIVREVSKADAAEVYNTCLDPATRILYADDLTWRPIGQAQPGDRLVAYDEHSPMDAKGNQGGKRKVREAVVEAVMSTRSKPVRITFDDGSSVVCSDTHRWLRHSESCDSWATVAKTPRTKHTGNPRPLGVGDRVRLLVDPWEQDDSRDAGYVAGIFDGEGHLPSDAASFVCFSQKDGAVLDDTEAALDRLGFTYKVYGSTNKSGVRIVKVSGMQQSLRLLGQTRPARLLAASRAVWKDQSPVCQDKAKRIASIERLDDERELIDLQTSTGTFIAEGLVSHNSTPSLDQFRGREFIYAGSSPWTQNGKFFENYQNGLEVDPQTLEPLRPDRLIIQVPSWGIYKDWERAHEIPVVPALPDTYEWKKLTLGRSGNRIGRICYARQVSALQAYDDELKMEERENPETFAVERRAHWAAALNAYLNPAHVAEMFGQYNGKPLAMQDRGKLSTTYVAHGDPSTSGANFGYAIGHAEGPDDNGMLHVVFDRIGAWQPGDFDDHRLDYLVVERDWKGLMDAFVLSQITFDQFNSASLMAHLQEHAMRKGYPKAVTIFERTATKALNWEVAETFKTALNMKLIHAPYFELAEQECLFLQDMGNGRVDKPSSGPVQTKDVFDSMAAVVHELIGQHLTSMLGRQLGDLHMRGSAQGGMPVAGRTMDPDQEVIRQFQEFTDARRGGVHDDFVRTTRTPTPFRRGGASPRQNPRRG